MDKRTRKLLAAVTLLLAAPSVLATEATPPAVGEAFFCKFNAGKDMDDLMSARDYYLKQMEKAEMQPPPAYLWTPFMGDIAIDVLWMNVYEHLGAFAAATDEGVGSAELESAMQRFNSVADCSSGTGWMRKVFMGSEAGPEKFQAPTFLQTFACDYRPGMGTDSLGDFVDHAAGWMGSSDAHKGYAVYTIVPMTVSDNSSDVVFVNVTNDARTWAEGVRAMYTTESGQQFLRHATTVFDCGNALWFGDQVVSAPPSN